MDYKLQLYKTLQSQIEEATKLKQPITKFVRQQIRLLEDMHDEFVSSTLKKDKSLTNNLNFAQIQIKQLQAISALCKKIGLPTEKYDKKIHTIRVNILGEDLANEHFN